MALLGCDVYNRIDIDLGRSLDFCDTIPRGCALVASTFGG